MSYREPAPLICPKGHMQGFTVHWGGKIQRIRSDWKAGAVLKKNAPPHYRCDVCRVRFVVHAVNSPVALGTPTDAE